MTNKRYCDFCDKEIEEFYTISTKRQEDFTNRDKNLYVDACLSCYDKIYNFLQQLTKAQGRSS